MAQENQEAEIAVAINRLNATIEERIPKKRVDLADAWGSLLYGFDPDIQRQRQKLGLASEANELANKALIIAAIGACGSLVTAIATLVLTITTL